MSKRDSKHSSSAVRLQKSIEESQIDKRTKLKKLIKQHGFDVFGVVKLEPTEKTSPLFFNKRHHFDFGGVVPAS